MAYELEPLKLKDGAESEVVFFLSKDGISPLKEFRKECRDPTALAKIATALESIHTIGIYQSLCFKRIKKLEGGDIGFFEIVTKNCTARAYGYLVGGNKIIVVAVILPKTHSGTGKRDVKAGIDTLKRKKPLLVEALKRREENGAEIRH